MVSLRNTAVLAAATLATSNAVTTLSSTDEEALMLELSVYVSDIVKNMQQYLSFRQQHPNEPYPSVLNNVVLEAAGSSDDSWTTALTGIAPSMVERMLTGVPWYSSRIYPALTSRFAEAGVAVEGINANAATSTAASTSSTSSTVATSSSSSSSKASSSVASSSSSAATTTTTASATKATSSTSNAQAISQISDGQVQATHSIEQQTNGGAKVVAGLGAGALAAAALLI